MANFSVGAGSPSPIPGQRVSKEAQKAQTVEKLEKFIKEASTPAQKGAAIGATVGGLGGIVGGLLGGLAGLKIDLPNNKSYTIQPGDNLNKIAQSQLGKEANGNDIEKFINKVLDLNPDVIKNPHEIYRGDTIAIPKDQKNQPGNAKQVQNFID